MKKLIYFASILLLCTGCEKFLDTQSYTQKNTETFPKTDADATNMLTGVYSVLNAATAANVTSSYFLTAELACDDRFGGGGANDKLAQANCQLLYTDRNEFEAFWQQHYLGIARANAAIAALDNMPEGDTKNQKMGEAKFLRAFFYFELVQLLGDVPLMKGAPDNVQQAKESPAQAPQDSIYVQVATDLWDAYTNMPSVKWNDVVSGTITKWAAAGLLARVYLFYTGFYNKTSLPTEEGEITAQQVADALKDCIDNSGHSLLPDYRSLWPYTNTLTKKDYPFAKDANDWVRDGQNPEQVFAVKMSTTASWSTTTGYSNQYCLFFGIRAGGSWANEYQDIFPIGQGWGFGTVNTNLWNQWLTDEPNDIRRAASIYNQANECTGTYMWGADSQMEETGLWQKKVVATTAYDKGGDPSALWNSFTNAPEYYDRPDDDFQISHSTDLNIIRYADILLMYSELTKTPDGINAVRARVNLPAIGGYTDAALRKERRYELAFEGTRWGDIRRWHIAEQALGTKFGVPIHNQGVATTMKPQGAGAVARYQATNGFFLIPQQEIDLANGALIQNAGWGTDAIFNAWVDN